MKFDKKPNNLLQKVSIDCYSDIIINNVGRLCINVHLTLMFITDAESIANPAYGLLLNTWDRYPMPKLLLARAMVNKPC